MEMFGTVEVGVFGLAIGAFGVGIVAAGRLAENVDSSRWGERL